MLPVLLVLLVYRESPVLVAQPAPRVPPVLLDPMVLLASPVLLVLVAGRGHRGFKVHKVLQELWVF